MPLTTFSVTTYDDDIQEELGVLLLISFLKFQLSATGHLSNMKILNLIENWDSLAKIHFTLGFLENFCFTKLGMPQGQVDRKFIRNLKVYLYNIKIALESKGNAISLSFPN